MNVISTSVLYVSPVRCIPRIRYICGAETIVLLRTSTGYHTTSEGIWNKQIMSDGEENEAHNCEDEQLLEKEIDKEIHKLYYL